MRLLKWVAAGLVATACIASAERAQSVAAKTCTNWEGREPIRGYCPDDYLRLDLVEERVDVAVAAAKERYFPLDLAGDRFPARVVQLRHGEEPSRGRRWRGEFSIVIDKDRSGYEGVLTRPKQPLIVEVRGIVHKAYGPIAEAFVQSSLTPQDPAWAEQVRRMLPPVEAVVRDIRIERSTTDSETCPVLKARVAAVMTLRPEPMQAPNKPGEPDVIPIYVHPEWYDVVVTSYSRVIYVYELDSDAAFFKWAEETVQALGPCWKPTVKSH